MKRWQDYEIEPWLTQKLWTQFVSGVGTLAVAIIGEHQDRGDEDRYARFTPWDWLSLGEPLP